MGVNKNQLFGYPHFIKYLNLCLTEPRNSFFWIMTYIRVKPIMKKRKACRFIGRSGYDIKKEKHANFMARSSLIKAFFKQDFSAQHDLTHMDHHLITKVCVAKKRAALILLKHFRFYFMSQYFSSFWWTQWKTISQVCLIEHHCLSFVLKRWASIYNGCVYYIWRRG